MDGSNLPVETIYLFFVVQDPAREGETEVLEHFILNGVIYRIIKINVPPLPTEIVTNGS